VPVVATSSPGTREIIRVGTDGFLVDQHDANALAAALERVLTDAALRARLAAGARESAQRFALPTVSRSYADVLASLIA
jgi:D-inositol-3-phosphate glycosyltransferase